MANAIRYSTTGDTQSLKKGNFFFGVGDVGKGPSSATTYYNGSTPSASGYTVYSFDASQPSRISYASPTSDSEFISITNVKSGQNFTGITQCLNWYATQTDHVSVNKDYEPIVSDGLVLNVDAGYTPSYSRSGTTWYDLSYNGYNPTLINGTTYNNSNGGVMVFDGVNDYVGFSSGYTQLNFTGSTPYTLEMFVKVDEITEGSYERLVDKEGTDMGSGRDGYNILTTKVGITSGSTRIQGERWVSGLNYGGFSLDKIDNTLISVWNHFVWSYSGGTNNSKFYNNGYLVDQRSAGGLITNILRPLGVMGPSGYNKGSVSSFKVYNRPLSSSEILQNYQAQFPRFLGKNIVMNGLIHYLDAGYNGSYPTSGTSWYNISGVSGGTGTLTNGPTYSSLNGGSIVFDGTNDYVSVNNFIGNLRTFTVCHFIYLEVSQNTRTIFSNYGSSNNGWVTGISDVANNVVKFYLGNTAHLYSNTVLTTGAWYQVSVTYNNGEPKIYINGIIDASSSQTITPASSYFGNDVGRLGASTQFFNGKINSVQVYNRALNATEISENYQAQLPTIVGENFITNGLVLYLDASYRASYPTVGTTWTNVSGVSGGTGTLTNGPTYDSANGGSIVFDGVDDKVDCGDPPSLRLSSTLTIQVIFYINSYNIWAGLIGKNNNLKSVYGLNLSPNSQRLRFNYNNISPWTSNVETTSTISTGQWIIASVTYDGENVRFYLNGVLDKTQYIGSVTFDTSAGYPLDIGWDNPGGDEYFNGKIAQAVIYNRALTQNEIRQNFNATKSRFGL